MAASFTALDLRKAVGLKGLKEITWPAVTIIVGLWFQFNYRVVLPPTLQVLYGPLIPLYMILAVVGWLFARDKLLKAPPFYISAGVATLAFGAIVGGFGLATGTLGIIPAAIMANAPFIALTVFVVAASEETFFRAGLIELFQGNIVIPAFAFAIFHAAAYAIYNSVTGQINFYELIFPITYGFLGGLIYIRTKDIFGLGLIVGLHAGINTVAAIVAYGLGGLR